MFLGRDKKCVILCLLSLCRLCKKGGLYLVLFTVAFTPLTIFEAFLSDISFYPENSKEIASFNISDLTKILNIVKMLTDGILRKNNASLPWKSAYEK